MKNYISNQSGRSMIEMLGVLAIVGVLSVAGIAGYSKAMAKYKVNKLIDQVSTVVANIRTTFAAQGNYKDLGDETAYVLGVFPEEMVKDCTSDRCFPKHVMGGELRVKEDGMGVDGAFNLIVYDISKDACGTLVTSDWGPASGFRGLANEDDLENYLTYSDLQGNGVLAKISDICSCPSTTNNCNIRFIFF